MEMVIVTRPAITNLTSSHQIHGLLFHPSDVHRNRHLERVEDANKGERWQEARREWISLLKQLLLLQTFSVLE